MALDVRRHLLRQQVRSTPGAMWPVLRYRRYTMDVIVTNTRCQAFRELPHRVLERSYRFLAEREPGGLRLERTPLVSIEANRNHGLGQHQPLEANTHKFEPVLRRTRGFCSTHLEQRGRRPQVEKAQFDALDALLPCQ